MDEMDKFLETYKSPKLTQVKIGNPNNLYLLKK